MRCRMIEILCTQDSYLQEIEVSVVEVIETEGRFAVILDQTPFYPEGGGQPSDTGWLDGLEVIDVQIVNGKVYHFMTEKLKKTQNVLAKIDFKRRLDHMQQHSGQHLLSAVAYRDFGAATVGFHMSAEYTTIDLDLKLTAEQLETLENTCNEMIINAMPYEVLYPTDEELNALPLRKKPTVDDGIRVVALGEYDYSPCGGTHLNSTAEIGMLKIRRADNYKQGVRIDFVCGTRALNDFQKKTLMISQLTQLFSAPENELMAAIDKKLMAFSDLSRQVMLLKESLLVIESENLLKELEEDVLIGEAIPLFIKTFEDKSLEELKNIALYVTNEATNAVLCLINQSDSQNTLVLARSKELEQPDCKALFKTLSQEFGVKGGGSPQMAQGGMPEGIDLDAMIECIKKANQN